MNRDPLKNSCILDVGANLNTLKGCYLRIGPDNLGTKNNLISKLSQPLNPHSTRLLVSPKLTVLLETKIGEELELIWLRPDLEDIWSYNLQNGFNSVSYEKYTQDGLAAFGSKQQQSYLVKVLVEPLFKDLDSLGLKEAWVALSQFMVSKNLPYRANKTAA